VIAGLSRIIHQLGLTEREGWRYKRTHLEGIGPVQTQQVPIHYLVTLVFVFKIVGFLALLCTAPPVDREQFDRTDASWVTADAPTWCLGLACMDAEYYLHLAAHHYSSGHPSAAFYPAWPYLLRCLSVPGNKLAPVWASTLAFGLWLSGCIVFFAWAGPTLGQEMAYAGILFNLLLPSSMFFWVGYSESLFFLLVCTFFCFSETRYWHLSALASFFLPLTRPVGVFVVVVPLLWLVARCRPKTAFLCLFSGLLGFSTYAVMMWSQTGDPFEGFRAQRHFVNTPSLYHFAHPMEFGRRFFDIAELHHPTASLLDRVMFVGSMVLLVPLWRMRTSWCLWAGLMLVLPAWANWFLSFSRFTIVVLPLCLSGGALLLRCRLWELGWIAMVSLAVQGYLTMRFLSFQWAN
jgi:hypothetical protein